MSYTEAEVADFEDVRSAPTGRASMFTPEVLLVRKRKKEEAKKKINTRPINDVLREAITKIFVDGMDEALIERLINRCKTVRHYNDLDPSILVLSAFLKEYYPEGLDPAGTKFVGNSSGLTYYILSQDWLKQYIESILNLRSKAVDADSINEVKTDIIAYYSMF
jgi:hypothetical protein